MYFEKGEICYFSHIFYTPMRVSLHSTLVLGRVMNRINAGQMVNINGGLACESF